MISTYFESLFMNLVVSYGAYREVFVKKREPM
ncbi:hypothetical protein VCHENC02_4928, partial [Vibrio harveyi]